VTTATSTTTTKAPLTTFVVRATMRSVIGGATLAIAPRSPKMAIMRVGVGNVAHTTLAPRERTHVLIVLKWRNQRILRYVA
jgi:hypothetical protein